MFLLDLQLQGTGHRANIMAEHITAIYVHRAIVEWVLEMVVVGGCVCNSINHYK